ncbi:MAG: exo-alpha-sialidase [Gammaproteobacteria bacterium]
MCITVPHSVRMTLFLLITLVDAKAGATGIPSLTYPPSGDLQEISSLDVYPDQGSLHVLLAGSAGGKATSVLRYLCSDDGGHTWSEPAAIYTGKAPLNQSIHRGNDVQIAAAGKRLVAVWQVPGSGFNGRGPLATAISSDGGDTWVSGPNPADDANHDDHAFVDLGADRKGRFHLVWLDNRGQERSKGLRYARSADGGRSWSRNATLDGKTCACCWNTLAVSLSGAVSVLYRAAEPRDMALAQSVDEGLSWRRLGPVGRFGWAFDGCPHVGGGLALGGAEVLHGIVWTEHKPKAGLHYLRSANRGRSWSNPQPLGEANGVHADIAALNDHHIAAAWGALGPEGSAILAAQSSDNGKTWSVPRRLSYSDAFATHPRIAATPFGLRVMWTEQRSKQPGVWDMARL